MLRPFCSQALGRAEAGQQFVTSQNQIDSSELGCTGMHPIMNHPPRHTAALSILEGSESLLLIQISRRDFSPKGAEHARGVLRSIFPLSFFPNFSIERFCV